MIFFGVICAWGFGLMGILIHVLKVKVTKKSVSHHLLWALTKYLLNLKFFLGTR